MSFDSNVEILSLENANVKQVRLVEESLQNLKWLLSLDLSYNQMKELIINFYFCFTAKKRKPIFHLERCSGSKSLILISESTFLVSFKPFFLNLLKII